MDKAVTTGLRKRQQINQANRMMFLWIAGVSVVVGISIVLTLFLVQKILFNEKVINEKNHTASILNNNISAAKELKDEIRVLNTNEALASVKLNDEPAIQTVLDALPAEANSTALASSLQMKLLIGVPGIVIETINVDSVGGDAAVSGGMATPGSGEISFTFSVSADSANYASLKQVLERIEKSIRPFSLTGVTVESQGSRVVMTVTGASYYQSAQTIQLTKKVVKP